MKELTSRISELITSSGLSNSDFAERIGTSSATISHILKGRNKPSLHVLLQIKEAFTNVNIDYMLTGVGSLYLEPQKSNDEDHFPAASPTPSSFPMEGVRKVAVSGVPVQSEAEVYPQEEKKTESLVNDDLPGSNEGDIEKILVLYKNGHFKVYKP